MTWSRNSFKKHMYLSSFGKFLANCFQSTLWRDKPNVLNDSNLYKTVRLKKGTDYAYFFLFILVEKILLI